MRELKKSDVMTVVLTVALLFVANFVLFAVGRLPVRSGGLPDWAGTFVLLGGVVMTLAMFSFLYKDNPVFRAAEHLFVGLGLGVAVAVSWYSAFKPQIYDILIAPIFDPTVQVQRAELLRLVPIALGLMLLLRMSRRHGWVSRYPMAILIGFWSGFSIQPTIHSNILRQITPTVVATPLPAAGWAAFGLAVVLFALAAYFVPKGGRLGLGLQIACGALVLTYILARAYTELHPHAGFAGIFQSLDRLIIMIGSVAVLFYFFFSLEHKGTVGAVSRAGIVFLMVAFGASFGYTVMARESLLIGRFQFLLGDWLGLLAHK